MLLTEFDFDRDAVINPDMIHKPVENFPETVISVFSHHLFQKLVDALDGQKIAETKDVDGIWPVYEVVYRGKRFAMYKARLGAPACVGCFEDIIPMGASGSSCWVTAACWKKKFRTAGSSYRPVLFGMKVQVTITLRPRITST